MAGAQAGAEAEVVVVGGSGDGGTELAAAGRVIERTALATGSGFAAGTLHAVAKSLPVKTPLALATAVNAGVFGGAFFMALEASSWVRGGRRDAVNGVTAGATAGGACTWVFSGGSPRKAMLGGAVYAVLGGLGCMAGDALGGSIMGMPSGQSSNDHSVGTSLEGLPSWFPVRKLSAEEAEEKHRQLQYEAEQEAAKSRQRWQKQ